MGLESHIQEVITDNSELKFGHDYWFDMGLNCNDRIVANKIKEILDESSQFAECVVNDTNLPYGARIEFNPVLKKIDDYKRTNEVVTEVIDKVKLLITWAIADRDMSTENELKYQARIDNQRIVKLEHILNDLEEWCYKV